MGLDFLTSNEVEEAGLYVEDFDERVHENNVVIQCRDERSARRWANGFVSDYILNKGLDDAGEIVPVAGYHDDGKVSLIFDAKYSEHINEYLSEINQASASLFF